MKFIHGDLITLIRDKNYSLKKESILKVFIKEGYYYLQEHKVEYKPYEHRVFANPKPCDIDIIDRDFILYKRTRLGSLYNNT